MGTHLSTPQPETGPIRRGVFTIYPDGTMVPSISGGDGDDPPPDPTTNPPADPPAPSTPPAPTTEPVRLADDHPLVKAYKAEKQKAAEARQKLTQYEDNEKTSDEKYADAVKARDEAEAKALRLEVAAAKGLTPAQAKRLVGTTQEELEADADELLTTFGSQPPAPGTPPSPKPSPTAPPRGGTDPTETPETLDPEKLAEFIPRP